MPEPLTITELMALLDELGRQHDFNLRVFHSQMQQGDWPDEVAVNGAEFREAETTPAGTEVPDRVRITFRGWSRKSRTTYRRT